MAEYVIDVELSEKHINKDIAERVIKVTVGKGILTYRSDILELFYNIFGNVKVVERIAKRKKADEWFVTLKEKRFVQRCLEEGSFDFRGIRYFFCDALKSVVHLRVHWLPEYINHSFLEDIFQKFGEVKKITEESSKVSEEYLHNGLMAVDLICTDTQAASIPHLIRIGAIQILVTSPGRAPLCLRCNCIGHMSINCPGKNTNNSNTSNSYADMVKGRNVEMELSESSESSESSVEEEEEEELKEQAMQIEKAFLAESERKKTRKEESLEEDKLKVGDAGVPRMAERTESIGKEDNIKGNAERSAISEITRKGERNAEKEKNGKEKRKNDEKILKGDGKKKKELLSS